MPTYVLLSNFTDQGIRNIKEAPQRLKAARKAVEAAGGKFSQHYLTMGQYDLVTIIEAPSDEAFATFALALGSQGNVRTTSLKAFTEEEFGRIVASIP